MIRTVLGDIDPSALGWCQCHEHLFLEKGRSCELKPALCMEDEEKAMQELQMYFSVGGRSYLDAQPGGAGRMAECMARASKETKVNIIACTGFHKTVFYDKKSFLYEEPAGRLLELFQHEIMEGMYSSDRDGGRQLEAKAGAVKVACETDGTGANGIYEKLYEAALMAAAKTGVAIVAHFEKDADVFALLKRMERFGIQSGRLIACHLDRMRYDIGYHKELAQAGVYLEYDTVNRPAYHDNKKEIRLIRAMLDAGYTNRILLSLDTTNKRLRSYGADMGLDYILTSFSNQLEASGISRAVLRAMMIDNPARALEIKK